MRFKELIPTIPCELCLGHPKIKGDSTMNGSVVVTVIWIQNLSFAFFDVSGSSSVQSTAKRFFPSSYLLVYLLRLSKTNAPLGDESFDSEFL